jgi:hypothetical protein
MDYIYSDRLTAREYSHRSSKLIRRAVLVFGFALALLLAILFGAA